MFLPFAFVRWEVSQTTTGIADLERDIQHDEELRFIDYSRELEPDLRESLVRKVRNQTGMAHLQGCGQLSHAIASAPQKGYRPNRHSGN
jgi:hypothetical protein